MSTIFISKKRISKDVRVCTYIEMKCFREEKLQTRWYRYEGSWEATYDKARDLSDLTEEELLETLTSVTSKMSAGESAKVVQISTTVVREELVPESDAYTESMRHSALSKLTEAERNALGLGALAVYDKVKFHGQ